MKKLFFLCLIALIWWFGFAHKDEIPVALSKRAFDSALGIRTLGRRFVLHRKCDRVLYKTARKCIDHRLQAWKSHEKSNIPKVIHQIWPFNEPIPDALARAAMTTKTHHGDFVYTLWTPSMFEESLSSLVGAVWKELSPQVIRDLAAATILWQHGGIVVDLETECVQTLAPLLELGNCIIGFEPPLERRSYQRRLVLSPSLIAAEAMHPLIQSWLTEMVGRIQKGTKQQRNHLWICQDSLSAVASQQKVDNILFVSPTYFCPIAPNHIHSFTQNLDGIKKSPLLRRILQALYIVDAPPFSQISRETCGVHMSGGRESKHSLLATEQNVNSIENHAVKNVIVQKRKEDI